MALTKYNYNSFDVTPVASKALAFNSGANGLTTAAEGSMVLIKTLTSDGSDATFSFIDGSSDVVLDSTYPAYFFEFISIHPETDNTHFTFNGTENAGTNWNVTKTTTMIDCFQNEAGTATSFGYGGGSLAQSGDFQRLTNDQGNANDECVSGSLRLFNPASTTFVKHFLACSSRTSHNDYAAQQYYAGYLNTTSAIDGIQFKFLDSGEIQGGSIKLYGIKDS